MNKKLFVLTIGSVIALTLVGCGKKDPTSSTIGGNVTSSITGHYNNEETPLIFSSQETDGVFNPFFSTNAADSNVVGLTQIGMIGNDKDGNPKVGEDEPVVVLDYDVTERAPTINEATTESKVTEYKFVLKNNIKFSNGSPLTMKDVLFNLYVYLDPVYTGSSTIYSTDIVGLKRYRTQSEQVNEQNGFTKRFQVDAEQRIQSLIDCANDVFYDHRNDNTTMSAAQFLSELTTKANAYPTYYSDVVADYKQALKFFSQELETDFTNSTGTYDSITFTVGGQVVKPFTTDVEAFLYNEGYITFDKKTEEFSSSLVRDVNDLKGWTKDEAIAGVYTSKVPSAIEEIVTYWNTGVLLSEYLVNDAMTKYFNDQKGGDGLNFKNISGITFANRTAPVSVKGKNYNAPTYNNDGSVKEGNEVLSIVINNIDPKAIWNFAFTVAPMYYYSDQAHIDAFDYESNFGVEYSSATFMNTVVKHPDKIGVPVGAGAYQCSKSSGGTTNVSAGDFKSNNVIYYERNDNFMMGKPKIKKIRYQIVSQNRMVDALRNGEIHFAEPNATPDTIRTLDAAGIANAQIQTAGYGYIGINAGKVPDVEVRRAIMHAIDIQECINYYQNTADPIYRPMSRSNWAYPTDINSVYYTYDGTGKKSAELVAQAGYTLGSDGILVNKAGRKLKYTFTIAGEETDHPAWQALYHASEVLNRIGFDITVTTDARALQKLSTGDLTVWAAAWGSTIDPDMYQVYHIDSGATSVLNWGYREIKLNLNNLYSFENALVQQLSTNIELARETNVQNERKAIYALCLKDVMDLAIELPTYQRKDLFAYNANVIDASTFTPASERSPYNGLTSRIWELSLNQG